MTNSSLITIALLIILCLLPALIKTQVQISNQIFNYNLNEDKFQNINEELLTQINQQENRKSWNRYLGGLLSKDKEIFIGFQFINRMINCKTTQACFELIFSDKIQSIIKNQGNEILELSIIDNKQAIFSSTRHTKSNSFYHSFSIMTNSGFVTIKIQSQSPLYKSESLKHLELIEIKPEYIGFPHQGFFENLDWNKIILNTLTPGNIKIPKSKRIKN